MGILDVFAKLDEQEAARLANRKPEVPLKANEVPLPDGRKLVYVQGPAITGGAPAVDDMTAQGMALQRMLAADPGPSRAMNPRPAQQNENYNLSEMLPASMYEAEDAKAAADYKARTEAAARLVRIGAADASAKI